MFDYINYIMNENFGVWVYAPLAIAITGLAFYGLIQKLRIAHMQNQMCIVRAMLYKLSIAPPGIKQEYEYWRTGNTTSIYITPECGPVYETTLHLYDMKMKLGPEASAVLLLYFIDLVDVSSVENQIGNCALRWARLIGCLPHIYAPHYEEIIMSEFNMSPDKESMVWIMMYLCGPKCLLTTRMFLLWKTYTQDSTPFTYETKKYLVNEESGTAGYHPKIYIPFPLQMSIIPYGLPSLLSLDAQYYNDRRCSVRLDWINKVQKTRRKLWNETNVSIERILSLVNDTRINCNLGSVLSPMMRNKSF